MSLTFLLVLSFGLLSDLPGGEEWKYDAVHLKSGDVFVGLIVAEGPERIVLRRILRKPGVRTVTREMTFEPADIERLDRLEEAERQKLTHKLALLDETGEKEKRRAQAVAFTAKPWPGGGPGLHYTGQHFELTSNAAEDLLRLAAVRLEDVFAAYVANLGVRRQPKERIKVILHRNVQDYQHWQKRRGLPMLNAAYYDTARNEIVIGSDLERLEAELEKVRQKHLEKAAELAEHERKLRKHYHGRPPAAALAQLRSLRRQMLGLNHDNDAAMERLRSQFFATLAHEAFHAYLEAYVYPSGEASVPRWLNEGLAQIFETALVETGELRVGHIDPARLAAVQAAVKQKQLVPLRELLRSTPADFSIRHATETWASDRHYLTSWALAYYLTFDRRLLGSEALHQYIQLHTADADRIALLERLLGQPLAEVEKEFHAYLLQLRPDGTRKRP